ncbi:MAG: nuclear transport factor 2 family protein [Acidobacteria bacterium]|nr:nuclear transport factor 2 family protein [Acidobacteriota bacterium]
MMAIENEQEFQKWKATTEASREVVQKAIDALNRGDAEGFINSFSNDLDFWMPGTTPVSGRTKGLPEFTALVEKVAGYLDVMITIKVTNFIACGEWVVSEAVGHGVTKNGQDYDNTYCHLWQVRDGKIVKFVEYNDTDLIMRVLCAQ